MSSNKLLIEENLRLKVVLDENEKRLRLHEELLNSRLNQIDAQEKKIQEQNYQMQLMCEQLHALKHYRFGRKSEQFSNDSQLELFNEIEVEAEKSSEKGESEPSSKDSENSEACVSAPPKKRRGKRRPLPPIFKRVEKIIEIDSKDQICSKDGTKLKVIGEVSSEQLDIIPAQIQVIKTVRKKYACPHCLEEIKTAPAPYQPIPKSIATAGLLAHIAVGKFTDGTPLYRQETAFARIGVHLPRGTMARWMIRSSHLLAPLMSAVHKSLISSDYIQADETPIQVLKEPGKLATSKSYMWLASRICEKPLVLYEYDPGRSQEVPLRFFKGFQGALQVDGYKGYSAFCRLPGVIRLGCMAHVRRKFYEAFEIQNKKPGIAETGLKWIQSLYVIEKEARENKYSYELRKQLRDSKSRPILEQMHTWMQEVCTKIPPQSANGKALSYAISEWPQVIRFLDDGRYEIDNNKIENLVRPFALGRKNWLFSDTVHGAKASATLYSLIRSAVLNDLEPFGYLKHCFEALSAPVTPAIIESLMPFNYKPSK